MSCFLYLLCGSFFLSLVMSFVRSFFRLVLCVSLFVLKFSSSFVCFFSFGRCCVRSCFLDACSSFVLSLGISFFPSCRPSFFLHIVLSLGISLVRSLVLQGSLLVL